MRETQTNTFTVTETNALGVAREYTVLAEQTNRPKMEGGVAVGDHLEWQFYCEELKLVLVRKSDRDFVAIDDPSRVFRVTEREQRSTLPAKV